MCPSATLISGETSQQCQGLPDAGVTKSLSYGNGRYYFVTDDKMGWNTAQLNCNSYGMILAELQTLEAALFIETIGGTFVRTGEQLTKSLITVESTTG